MIRLFTTLFLLAICAGFASAQTFSVSANEVWTIAPQNEPDVEGYFVITNVTGVPQTIKWERSVVNITTGCATKVCDINLCYLEGVNSKTFELGPGATGNIIMHFLNWDSLANASGVINLKMSNVNNPADSTIVTFLFTSPSSSTHDGLANANVVLFPNPTTDYFRLEQADAVHRIRVFSLDSREVARFTATPGAQYSLAGQTAGTYILALEDANGRVFQALNLVKK